MALHSNPKRLVSFVALLLVASAVLIIAVVKAYWPAASTRSVYMVGSPEKGSALFYGDKQCGICHAINGLGGRVAPDLSAQRPETPAMGWLVAVLWNHGPGMWRQIRQQNKPFPELDPQEAANLLAFLYQATHVDKAGDPESGKQLFSEKGCVQCHSVDGVGGKIGPDLSSLASARDSAAWASAMFDHAQSMIGPITSTLGQWPQLKGNEMSDLIAYVSKNSQQRSKRTPSVHGNPEQGWAVFQQRCIQCHSVRGQGGNVGPALGPEHDVPLSTAAFASVMWNHAPEMLQQSQQKRIPAPTLQGNEMSDLLSFLASIRYFEPTGSAQAGARVFADRGCSTCHGLSAEGTKLGPAITRGAEPITAASLTAMLWRHGPRMIDRAEEMGMSWPKLQPTDVGNLVSFLNTREAKR